MLADPTQALWEVLKARGLDMSPDAFSNLLHTTGVRVIEADEKAAAKAFENGIRVAALG